MNTITAITIVHNEEKDIVRCLKSLQWADEVIVVDSYSTDKTVDEARALCTTIIQREMKDFSCLRNSGISQARSEWVLMVDADEIVSSELATEIRKAISDDAFDGYYLNRINYMYGIKLEFDQPDYHLRLFKREKTRYAGYVHETAIVKGQTSKLNNSLIHYSMKNLTEHIDKMNLYTDLSSSHASRPGLRLFLKPFYRLYEYFIKKRSYSGGVVGIILALNAFFYEFVSLFKIWERKYAKKNWFNFYRSVDIEKEIGAQKDTHGEFIRLITDSSPKLLLEVGTGAAAISFSIIKDKNIPVVVVDNNFNILKQIQSNAQKLRLKVVPVCADAFRLPFKEKAFTASFSQGLLEHFGNLDTRKIINEKLRVSSDSAFFSVPNNYYKHKDFGNERLISKREWEESLSGFGLLTSRNYYYVRTKKNFLLKRPLMYMARVKEQL